MPPTRASLAYAVTTGLVRRNTSPTKAAIARAGGGRCERVDVFRKGYYSPTKWESFENITRENKQRYQASDHHCVWAELDL
jgi:hypothetical protein